MKRKIRKSKPGTYRTRRKPTVKNRRPRRAAVKGKARKRRASGRGC